MAATTRAASPATEPFPALETPRTPTSLTSTSKLPVTGGENPNLIQDTTPKSDKRTLSPLPLTGAAAMAELRKRNKQKAAEDSREMSPNPAVQAMQSLMGSGGMSRPSDAPAPDKLSEPMQKAAEKMNVDNEQSDSQQASPVSLSSFGTLGSMGAPSAMTATATDTPASGQQFVAEPAQMTEPASYVSSNGNLDVPTEPDGPKAYSYPGPPPTHHQQQQQEQQSQEGGPSRGMSLPGYGQGSPKSPASSNNKRHKCPYCSTDFTRHHNLKSHLLTHSQEKPYVCQTCQARFRRLHDLKRHTKLHTGERPHTCDKCGRRFARGDALARHNKGPGGCAGRRSSFGGDDDFGGDGNVDGMDGVEYDDEGSSPDNGRRGSEPSRKRAHLETPNDPNRQVYRQHSSTYPPPFQAPQQNRSHASSVGNMGPPQVVLQGSQTATSPRDMSGQPSPSLNSSYYGAPGQVLPQGAMIESPKPLSPGQPGQDTHRLSVGDTSMSSTMHRNRSPSLTTQFQQQHFGRGSGHRTPPQPPVQFPSHHGAPVLPPLTSQPQSRPGLAAIGPGPSMLQHGQVPPHTSHSGGQGSNPGSLSSHGRSSGSSLRDHLAGGQEPPDIWAYVRSLESRFSRMQDEYELRISRLQEEVISLKGQISNAASYSSEMGQPSAARY